MEKIIQENISNKESLNKSLLEHQIPVENWGSGVSKTLDHLVKEINSGEAVVEENQDGVLERKIAICLIDVFYHSPNGQKLHLVEDKQIFKDGRERKRKIGASVSEKIHPDEPISEILIQRALAEELGISGNLEIIEGNPNEETAESPSYPGLMTKTKIYRFSVNLDTNQFNPEGYVEHQPDKDTYFKWE